ncbi:MAG TPA: hypothetical protein PKD26_15790 [Pyrinomonadaceae bacterium]|nr:hypothetical protein [Pyrinomonadaceae bacterium]
MKIINLLINEDLLKAELALEKASADDVVELGITYLEKLKEYREQLHQLGGIPEISFAQQSRLGRELIEQSRKAVRAAIEVTTNERNRVESLVDSLTMINGWDAATTFNRLKHKDSTDWELAGAEVRIASNGERMTVTEAVETAGKLRREAYISGKIVFTR